MEILIGFSFGFITFVAHYRKKIAKELIRQQKDRYARLVKKIIEKEFINNVDMGTEEQYNMLTKYFDEFKTDFKDFKKEVRDEIKILSANISTLKTKQAVSKKEIAIYLGLLGLAAMEIYDKLF